MSIVDDVVTVRIFVSSEITIPTIAFSASFFLRVLLLLLLLLLNVFGSCGGGEGIGGGGDGSCGGGRSCGGGGSG